MSILYYANRHINHGYSFGKVVVIIMVGQPKNDEVIVVVPSG